MKSTIKRHLQRHILTFAVVAWLFIFVFIYTAVNTAVNALADISSSLPTIQETSDQPANLSPEEWIAPASCRYGAAYFTRDEFPFLQEMGVGWTLDFTVRFRPSMPANIEYTPMVRMRQKVVNGARLYDYAILSQPLTDDPGGLGPIIQANPGRLWMVGNEVDRITHQDDMMPDIYAKAYHDVYSFIKSRDASAQVAISGLVQVTPGRLQYLDLVWDHYLQKYGTPMPVDVWNMHLYVLPEKKLNGEWVGAAVALGTDPALAKLESFDPDGSGPLAQGDTCAREDVYCFAEHDDTNIFVTQVLAMRQWMKAHGQQNKPLILSEYSLLYPFTDYDDPINPSTCYLQDEFGNCFTAARVSAFMLDTFSYLETAVDPNLGYPADNGRLVQQWLWFATYHEDISFASNLLTRQQPGDPFSLTDVGVTYRDWVTGQPQYSNPKVDRVAFPTADLITPTATVSVTLDVSIRNNGNIPTAATTVVAFYANAAGTQEIGSIVMPAGLGGCARHAYQTPPVVWGGLGAGLHRYWIRLDGIPAGTGFVLVNPQRVFLPVSQRE